MNALVSLNSRFAVTPDGRLWTQHGELAYGCWARYLDVYTEVRLLVRASPRAEPEREWSEVTGPCVTGAPVFDFHTSGELVKELGSVRRAVQRAVDWGQALHLRAPCLITGMFWRNIEQGRPYGIEVIGDPYDALAPGAFMGRLRRSYRAWFTQRLRRQCAGATAVAYISQRSLQERYPASPTAFATSFSDVDLPPAAFASAPLNLAEAPSPLRVVVVGSLDQPYKGVHVLIDAVAACAKSGVSVDAVVIGDGRQRTALEAQVVRQRLGNRVRFVGRVPAGAGVQEHLNRAHLFVLPSLTEGLPKALVEAMARGLPCIGSRVGGIPELLRPEDMVRPGDAPALAEKIMDLARDPARLNDLSARNLRVARGYRQEVLRERRVAFYEKVRAETEEWMRARSQPGSSGRIGIG